MAAMGCNETPAAEEGERMGYVTMPHVECSSKEANGCKILGSSVD